MKAPSLNRAETLAAPHFSQSLNENAAKMEAPPVQSVLPPLGEASSTTVWRGLQVTGPLPWCQLMAI